MKATQHQCYQLARALNPKEWKLFLRQVASLKQKKFQDLKPLSIALQPSYPQFLVKDEDLFRSAFSGSKYDNARLRVLRSYLKDLLEDFIIRSELARDAILQKKLLIHGLQHRGCLDAAHRVLQIAQQEITAQPLRTERLDDELALEESNLDLFVRRYNRTVAYDWSKLLEKVDQVAFAKRLRFLCAMISTLKFRASGLGMDAYPLIKAHEVAASQYEFLSAFTRIYFHLLSLLIGLEQDFHFSRLEALLALCGSQLEPSERTNILALMVNYFLMRSRQGDLSSAGRTLKTYQEMHRLNLIFDKGQFTINSVRNIISFGTRMGELTWLREFLEVAQQRIPAPDAENVYHFGMAWLDFAEGKYSEAKRHLSRLDYADPYYKIAHDSFLLRISYETGDQDSFESVYASLKRHTYRPSQVVREFRKGIQNFLKVTFLMFEMRLGSAPQDTLLRIRNLLTRFESISYADWIQSKILELEALHPKPDE